MAAAQLFAEIHDSALYQINSLFIMNVSPYIHLLEIMTNFGDTIFVYIFKQMLVYPLRMDPNLMLCTSNESSNP